MFAQILWLLSWPLLIGICFYAIQHFVRNFEKKQE